MNPVPVVCLPLGDGTFYVRVEGGAFTPDEVLSMSMQLAKRMQEHVEGKSSAPVTRLVVPRG